MEHKQPMKDLGSALDELVHSLGIHKKLREYDAVTQWAALVGEHIATVAVPVRITQGVLIVRVRTSTWRNELTLRKKEIIDRLNGALGGSIIKDIRFQ